MTHTILATNSGIPDQRKLEIIREKLDELTGPQWTLTDDGTITSRGSTTVRLGAQHDDLWWPETRPPGLTWAVMRQPRTR